MFAFGYAYRGAIMQAAGAVAVGAGNSLEGLNIENTFVTELPGDPETKNVPRQVFGALHTAGT
jgi:hypothetical protein